KHNAVNAAIRNMAREAGWVVERGEPRHLHIYTCDCKAFVGSSEESKQHRNVCPFAMQQKFRSTGPDLMITDDQGNTYLLDLTLRSPLCRTHAHIKDPQQHFAEMDRHKHEKYDALVAPHGTLVPMAALTT